MSAAGLNGAGMPLDALPPLPRWVAWQTEEREPGKPPTKVPYAPNSRRKAKADDPATWGTRTDAERRAAGLPKPFGLGGVALEFGDLGDGRSLGGIDLDTCRAEDGAFAPWAMKVMERFVSYTEVSPSGSGAKVFFLYATTDLPALRKAMGTDYGKQWKRVGEHNGAHPPAIELYLGNRHFAWTDERLVDAPDELRPIDRDTLLWLITKAGPAFSAAASGTDTAADGQQGDLQARIEAATSRWPR